MGTGSFRGVKSGRGVTLTPHPLLVQWPWKGRTISIFPLWAVRPVQSLSACTMVTFTLPYRLLTSLLTYSMAQSPSWKANRFWGSQEFPRILCKPKVHYRVDKSSPPVPILSIAPQFLRPSGPKGPDGLFVSQRTGSHSAGIHVPFTNCFFCRWFCVVHDQNPPLHSHNWLSFGKFQDTDRFLNHCERHFSSRLPPIGGTWKYAKTPSTKKTWRDSLPIDMLLSATSLLVVAQSSSEIPEGLMNNPAFPWREIWLWLSHAAETSNFLECK